MVLEYIMDSHMSSIKTELKGRVHVDKLNGTDGVSPQKRASGAQCCTLYILIYVNAVKAVKEPKLRLQSRYEGEKGKKALNEICLQFHLQNPKY